MQINCTGTPLENKYQIVQTECIKEIKIYTTGQYRAVAIQIIKDIISNSKSDPASLSFAKLHIEQALDLLFSLKSALNENGKVWDENEKLTILYNDYNWSDGLKPWIVDTSRIDIVALSKIISTYLSYEWFSSATFEWFLINPYLRYCIQRNRNDFIFAQPVSAGSMAACCSTKESYVIVFLILKTIGFIIGWPLFIFLIILAFINGWIITSFILAAAQIVFTLFSIILFPTRRKLRRKNEKTLLELINLKTHVSEKLWSTTFVMEKIIVLNQEFMMPELIPLLSKMIKRNDNVFNANWN